MALLKAMKKKQEAHQAHLAKLSPEERAAHEKELAKKRGPPVPSAHEIIAKASMAHALKTDLWRLGWKFLALVLLAINILLTAYLIYVSCVRRAGDDEEGKDGYKKLPARSDSLDAVANYQKNGSMKSMTFGARKSQSRRSGVDGSNMFGSARERASKMDIEKKGSMRDSHRSHGEKDQHMSYRGPSQSLSLRGESSRFRGEA